MRAAEAPKNGLDLWQQVTVEVEHRTAAGARCRISSLTTVVKAIGVTGPSAARSSTSTTRCASSIVEMNGISRRSNRSCGNWISSALPIVSALIPVLLERKNTGVAGTGAVTGPVECRTSM